MTFTFDQLARTSLLPEPISSGIFSGKTPSISEVLMHLLITAQDAHFLVTGDPKSSWTERRLSHQNFVNAFMLALLLERTDAHSPETQS
jgi:hypothetical protein